MALTIRERMVLTIAAATYTHPAQRHNDYHHHLGMTPTRAAQLTLALLNRPDAEAEMPTEVRRLRRIRDARLSARTAQAANARQPSPSPQAKADDAAFGT